MTFREALNISPEMPLNYENIVNALGYEDVKHCIPIGLNQAYSGCTYRSQPCIIPKTPGNIQPDLVIIIHLENMHL